MGSGLLPAWRHGNAARVPGTWLVRLGVCACLLAAAGCSLLPATPSRDLERLFQAYARDTAPYFPVSASESGNRQFDSQFANDLSEDYRRGLIGLCQRYLDAVAAVPAATLSRQERLSIEIFRRRLDECVDSERFAWYLRPINQAGSWAASFPVMGAGKGSHPFKTVRNYEDFLKRMDGFVAWTDTAVANMRAGMRAGVTQPRDLMVSVLPQLDAQIVERADQSLFFTPIRQFPQDFDAASRAALTAQYTAAIETRLVPAYRRLRDFIRDEYIPACRTTAGLWALPDGAAMYSQAVRRSTTLDVTPDQVYRIGLAEVSRLETRIRQLQSEIDAAGDPPLPTYPDTESLLAGYRALGGLVSAKLPSLFGKLPASGYEVRAIEAYRERSMSSSYIFPPTDGSRPGVFYLNAASNRNATGAAVVSRSLFLHEVIPGHHLQVSLQVENRSLPLFRRKLWYAAFGEGWALYAEQLGTELGVYANRRDRLDMLQGELFRSARLVVDVGLHEKRWTRQQAIDYLLSHGGGGGNDNAQREIERYMAWPGQALSYKMGQLKIQELRQRAQTRLGAAFDLRAFHDALLADGAMPLDLLERNMDAWIAARQNAGSEGP